MLWVFDLDGVVWLAGRAIPGSAEAIEKLRGHGESVVFVTNNSTPSVTDYVGMLSAAGVEVGPDELISSGQAAASVLTSGSRAACVGGPGVLEAVGDRGVEIVPARALPDTVVVGRSLTLDFASLADAATAIRDGARFLATNTDATFPTPDGLEPGAGALVAYLEVGSGRRAEVAGKPEQPMADLVKHRFGQPGMVVGDRYDTDGLFAKRIGSPFALVLTGVTKPDQVPSEVSAADVAPDLAAVVARHLDA
jgi:HAD superfamily hydrolase (TIGR01450 family)